MDCARLKEIEDNLDALQSTMGNGTKLSLSRFKDRAEGFVFEDAVDLLAEVRRLRAELQKHEDVTRVELIVNSQRERVIYGASEVMTALQDDGRTLKVFLKHE